MVFAPQSFEDSPLALLRLARSQAEVELRRSLVKASMFALTLCVSVLVTRALFFVPVPIRIIDIPTWDDPRRPMPPPSDPARDFAPPRATPDSRGEVVAVEKEIPVEPERLVPPSEPIRDGIGKEGSGIIDTPIRGNGEGVAPPPEPKPEDFVFTETLPTPVHQVKPDYPPIARDAGMEGKVVVRMLVGLDGKVRKAEIEKSSAMFDEVALAAARQWIFTPALTDGKPVLVWVRVPFDFRLH